MKKSTISNINNDTQRQIHPLKVFVSQATPTNIQSISEQSLPNNPVLAKMSFKQQQQQQQQQQQRFSQPPKATSWIHMSHKNILHNENNTPPFRQNLAGPYIIDLSSGEELIALHLGNNDNKRRRDEDNDNESMSPIESTSSPTEVFEYQEDGNLLPIRDYFPMQPSPAKKFRLAKCSHQPSLRFLSDSESDVEREGGIRIKKQKDERLTSGNRPYHRSKLQRRSGADITWKKKSGFSQGNNSSTISSRRYGCDEAGDSSANDVVFEFQTRDHHKEATYQIESIQDDTIEDKPSAKIEKNEIALLPTPKLYSLSNGLRDFDWSRWEDMNTANIVFYEQSMGNELVLYNGRGSTRLDGGKGDDYGYSWKATGEDNYQSSVVIHELDDEDGYEDDDGNFADDEACELSDDGPLIELEEKIMDMDLY
ncbi:hypothetical protein BGZ76_009937 [Entomortierella beljakovae]|nr:hypothetical protein BGZ76_009937 [Entomortierella beljakovae]